MCGLKSFFKKVGNGFKKAGCWIRDKALPAVGRIVKPVLNVIGMLPGKIGMIGKIGSAITGVLHNATDQIPNKDTRDKINRVIDRGNTNFSRFIDKGQAIAEGINGKIGVGRNIVDAVKQGYQNQIKPAIPSKRLPGIV